MLNVYDILKNSPRPIRLYSQFFKEIPDTDWSVRDNHIIISAFLPYPYNLKRVVLYLDEYMRFDPKGDCEFFLTPEEHTWFHWPARLIQEGDYLLNRNTCKCYLSLNVTDHSIVLESCTGDREFFDHSIIASDFIFADQKSINDFKAHQIEVSYNLSNQTAEISIDPYSDSIVDMSKETDDILHRLNNINFFEEFEKEKERKYKEERERAEKEKLEFYKRYQISSDYSSSSIGTYIEAINEKLGLVAKDIYDLRQKLNGKADRTVILGDSL